MVNRKLSKRRSQRKRSSKRKKRSQRKQRQKGGRVTMPSEYFGVNSGRYFPKGSPQLAVPKSAYGVNKATSRGADIGNNMMGPDLGPTRHSGKQTGGKKRSQRRKRSQRKRSQRKRSSKRKQRGGAIRSGSRLPGDQFVKYTQVGSSYRYVTNPKTGRKLDIFGKKGKAVLRKFFKEGGMKMPKY